MEIRIYSPELKFLGVIENQTSLIWTRKYYEPGNFELHAPITKRNLLLLAAGNIIAKRDAVASIIDGEQVLYTEAGIIGEVENEETNDKNEITRKGHFLSYYFDRTLIESTMNFNGTIEDGMREIAMRDKKTPLVILGKRNGFTETISFQATMKNKNTYLSKLARAGVTGFRLRPDFKKKELYFETYQGVNRTTKQGVNSRVIFSETYNNLNNAIYKYNEENLRNCAIVGGQGEGSARTYVTVYSTAEEPQGRDLRQIFVDAKDVSSEGLTQEEYLEALRQRGYDTLNEKIATESFECETEAEINFTYKVNYDLGDIVTVKKKGWNIEIDQRITELQEVYEYGGMYVVPTLGDALPETIDWSD